jgi:hypothetical protein
METKTKGLTWKNSGLPLILLSTNELPSSAPSWAVCPDKVY